MTDSNIVKQFRELGTEEWTDGIAPSTGLYEIRTLYKSPPMSTWTGITKDEISQLIQIELSKTLRHSEPVIWQIAEGIALGVNDVLREKNLNPQEKPNTREWRCIKCKVDRLKEPCPGPYSSCPVVANAQNN